MAGVGVGLGWLCLGLVWVVWGWYGWCGVENGAENGKIST